MYFVRVAGRVYFIVLSLALFGCSSIPDLPKKDHVNIADVIYSIRCELAVAVYKYRRTYPWLSTWAASAKLDLKVIETGEKSGGASLVIPITNGTFTIGFTVGRTRKATRTATVEAPFDLGNIDCPRFENSANAPIWIQGGLGLREWIERAAVALEASKTAPSSIAYSITFNIKANGSVTPSFNVIQGNGNRIGGNFKLAGTREDEHKLTITAGKKKDRAQASARFRDFQAPIGPETQKFLDFKQLQNSIDVLRDQENQ